MANRTTPYGAFNFLVNIGDRPPESPLGGFAEVSGLVTEMTVAEYRNGNDKLNHVQKVPGVHKVGDVTLKRGVVNSQDVWSWMSDTRTKGPAAKRQVTITLRDEAGQDVQVWTLNGVIPLKYTGPTLTGKGGGDVSMEELVLSCEGYEITTLT